MGRGTEIFLLHWAIMQTVEIDGANIQQNYIKKCVRMHFGNLVTIMLRQKLRLKLF